MIAQSAILEVKMLEAIGGKERKEIHWHYPTFLPKIWTAWCVSSATAHQVICLFVDFAT